MNKTGIWWRAALFLATVALALPVTGNAQTAATIVGDVTDPSGAAIPGATVRATNESTGLEREVQTNTAGQYRITPLNPGTYTVRAEAAGFTAQVRSSIVLQVSAVLNVDFTMELGEVTETIEVTGAAPIMQTEEASVGNVVNSQELERLPVNQRNYTRLILLSAGTSSIRRSQERGTDESGTELYSVNGGRPQDNNYTLDGIDSNMQMMNSPGISPPMDAIQEFKVGTNTGADFGRSMGANVSMVLKSGSRNLHGSVYEFVRNNAFDANEFFANRNGLPKTPFRLNQYGLTLGGPVVLPGANWRDKMFWFVSWEGFRRRRGSTQLTSQPPQAFRNGDFSALTDQTITNPLNNDQPFDNNMMPAAMINPAIPTSLDLLNPLPNRSGLTQNYADNRSVRNNRDSIHWRWDYQPTSNDTFFFRYSFQNADLFTPNSNPNYDAVSEFDVTNYGGTWTHIFGPTTVLDVRFGTNQPDNPGLTTNSVISRGEYFDQTGIQMYQREVFGDPLVGIGFGQYGITGGGGSVTGDNVWQWNADMSKTIGRHNLTFGGQYHYREFYTDTSNPMNGNATFNGQITGFPMADALLGYPTEIRRGQGNTLTDGVGHFTLLHFQDDWRVNQKLTINIGLMYQMGTRPYDRTDRLGNLQVLRDPASGEYMAQLMWGRENPQPAPPDGLLTLANSQHPEDFVRGQATQRAGYPRALIQNDWTDFAPRLGLAYKVTDRTVIRTGFGMYYNSTFVQELQDLRKFWPFTVQQVFSPNRGSLDLSITDPGPSFESTAELGGWPQNPENRTPYSMQWNFFIQQQLMDDLTLDVGYVGSASRKQIGYSPFNNAINPGPGPIGPRRLLPFLGDLDGGSNQYNGSYNGLQVTLKKRFSAGLQFNMNYSYQKALDGQSSLAEVKVQNPFRRDLDYSRSSWDVTHVFNFAYVYELPFGRGRKWGSNWHTALDMIAGGWSIEGITRFDSAPPFFITTGQDIANTGRSQQRPDLVGDPNNGPKTVEEWINTDAFVVPEQYTFGNAGQYIAVGDDIVNLDVAVQKVFPTFEGQQFEFRTEFFNIANLVNFGDPIGSMNRNDFGVVTSQRTNPRQIQFGLRYRF